MSMAGDIPEKNSSSVSSPASGTYGEKADLSRLQSQLPPPQNALPIGSGPQQGQSPSSAPIRPPSSDMGSPIPGLPSQLFTQPTQRPSESPTTMPPMGGSAQPSSLSGQQQRLMILDALANDPSRSEQTREWAKIVIAQLTH